jgi:hypothetical protein
MLSIVIYIRGRINSNRNMKKVHCIVLLLLLCMFAISAIAQESELITISGVVKDKKNHHEIEYVNVFAGGTNQGTVTNMDGIFTIKIRNAQTLEFSRIGYESARISIESLKQANNVIYLRPKTLVLSEVVVSPIDAAKIVSEAFHRIPSNYSNQPILLTGFYRETIQKRKRYINISEAVTNVYKSEYTANSNFDRVKIIKGRHLVSPNQSDTLSVKLEGGPVLAIGLDMIKNPFEFLDDSSRQNYAYSFADYVTIDDRNHYAIRFIPARIQEYPLYDGILYIDQKTLTISRIEFSINISDPLKVTKLILKKKPIGLRFEPLNLTYLVDYRSQNDRSHVNYVRADIRFKCDWHKRLFHTSYAIVSEMVMTDCENNATAKIPYHDSFKPSQILSDKVDDFYDPDFWGDYNIIEPTESLEHAVKKLKKSYDKLNVFVKPNEQ